MSAPVRTTCPYCGVGCGVLVRRDPGGKVVLAGDRGHPANFGRLCSKGAALAETLSHDGRLLYPRLGGRRIDWPSAIATVADGFSRAMDRHGPEAVAFYVSGQLLTEDYYVANKLMKGFIGAANIDTNSRLCMASTVAGHTRAFGSDTVPGCYEDIEEADLVVLTGSNLAWCHPVLFQRLSEARERRGTRVVAIDPRRTVTCQIADLHMPLKPGSDVLLWNGLLAHLAQAAALDRSFIESHTQGFVEALAAARNEAGEIAAIAAGTCLNPDDLARFFDWFATTEKTVTVFSQGVNQSAQGTDKVNAILNCHLATGRIGRPGMGPFSATGQPNAMGGREVGGLANQLAAHMGFEDAALARVARFWQAPRIARGPGRKAVDMFQAVAEGRIKAIWIMATNPAVSLPETDKVRRGLEACEMVVVSDCVAETDTTRYADVLLPAAAWGEKDGTVTNSERTISRQRRFIDPPGEARPDWWIVTQVARRMGWTEQFAYESPADIFREHAALSGFENQGDRRFDIGGLAEITDSEYDAFAPVQWPLPKANDGKRKAGGASPKRLFADGGFATPDTRARFVAVSQTPSGHAPGVEFPLVLNTGRVRDQWHTMTRTGKSPRLAVTEPEPFAEVHPGDAEKFGLSDGGLARIANQNGEILIRVRLSAGQQPGSVFVPMHWSDAFTGNSVIGRLVPARTDPISGQPDSKNARVRISPFAAGWSGFLISRRECRPRDVDYWCRHAAEQCFVYELAGAHLPDAIDGWAGDLLEAAATDELIRFRDPTHGIWRWVKLHAIGLDACLFVSRSEALPERDWLLELFRHDRIDASAQRVLLGGAAPTPGADEGRIVCACFGVGLKRLVAAIGERKLTSVEAIGQALKAGTNCGSCLPELKELLGHTRPNAA
ncbi:MAG: molybdopterin-dependent oxidoreductase [Pseudomonadota bacterium]